MLPAVFGSILPSSFRGDDFWSISQSETRFARGGYICCLIGTKLWKLYRRPPIDAPCQVWLHLAQWFQRRTWKCEKLTDDGRFMVAKAHPHPSGQVSWTIMINFTLLLHDFIIVLHGINWVENKRYTSIYKFHSFWSIYVYLCVERTLGFEAISIPLHH